MKYGHNISIVCALFVFGLSHGCADDGDKRQASSGANSKKTSTDKNSTNVADTDLRDVLDDPQPSADATLGGGGTQVLGGGGDQGEQLGGNELGTDENPIVVGDSGQGIDYVNAPQMTNDNPVMDDNGTAAGSGGNSGGGTSNPVMQPPAVISKLMVHQLHRSSTPADSMLSFDASEGAGLGYSKISSFKVAEFSIASDDNYVEIFRCNINGDHFVSRDPNCEGQVSEGSLHFVFDNSIGAADIRMDRCRDPANGNHAVALAPTTCAAKGMEFEGTLGYVFPASSQ